MSEENKEPETPIEEQVEPEKADSTDMRVGQQEHLIQTVEESQFPMSAVPEFIVDEQEELRPIVIHPEFKAECVEIADLLENLASDIRRDIQEIPILDSVSLAEAEQGLGFRYGRMELHQLPTNVSSKVSQAAALMNRLQDKIPSAMRLAKAGNEELEELSKEHTKLKEYLSSSQEEVERLLFENTKLKSEFSLKQEEQEQEKRKFDQRVSFLRNQRRRLSKSAIAMPQGLGPQVEFASESSDSQEVIWPTDMAKN